MSLRVLIAVTHLLGAGHLTRAAALARAFARAGHATTLVSGGVPAPLVSTAGVELVQLPSLRIAGTAFTSLLDETGAPAGPERLAARRSTLVEALRSARPDVVVTELFPFGRRALAQEFLALVEEAHARRPRPLVACSIRDILVAPGKPGRIAETHRRLTELYDAVLVHGDPALAALNLSWPVDEGLRPMLRYTGYVDEGEPVSRPSPQAATEILVSGGSSAAALPLHRAAVQAARLVADRPWRILVGAGVDEASFEALRRDAPAHAAVERARPDFRALLAGAAVSVSQAGYNTAVDLLHTGTPAVLVPFEDGRETEQRLRAERLAALGLAQILPEAALSPQALAQALRKTASRPARPLPAIRLDGAERTVAVVEGLRARRAPVVARPSPNWSPLDHVLRRTADAGRTVAWWWRDDDAVAHTPALDRLLEVARAYDLPIVLAAVPGGTERSLTQRLGDEPQAFSVVHGFRHANHAPPGDKKSEFGPHRPLESLARDARAALEAAREAFGAKLLAVFAPPWNRVAPGLLPRLPALGYRAVSTYGARAAAEPAPGLRQVNTHLDPIDWRGTRGLAPADGIVARLAAALSARLDGEADADEPIGLLTHHLVHDEAVWRFCGALLDRLRRYDALRYPSPHALFREERGGATAT